MSLSEIIDELTSRKINQRALRLSTPIARRHAEDEVPSPKMKVYASPLEMGLKKTNRKHQENVASDGEEDKKDSNQKDRDTFEVHSPSTK